jgi:hypothetical protein
MESLGSFGPLPRLLNQTTGVGGRCVEI